MKSDKEKQAIIDQLHKLPIIEIACSKSGVSRMTFYRWKKQDTEFAKQVDDAMAMGKSLISDVAESQLISAIKKGDMRGIIFWLKHNREEYKTKVELSGTLLQIREELTDEEVEILRQALELAGFEDTHLAEVTTTKTLNNHEPGKTELPDLSHQA